MRLNEPMFTNLVVATCKQDRTLAKNFMSLGRVGDRVGLSGRKGGRTGVKGRRSVNKQI